MSSTTERYYADKQDLRNTIIDAYHDVMRTRPLDQPPTPIMRELRKAAFTVNGKCYA